MRTRMLALSDRVLWSTGILISARLRRRHRLVKRAHPRFGCEQPKLTPRIGNMGGKAPTGLHRTREIVMSFVDLWRQMLEHTRDQTNLLRCVHRQKGRRRPTKVVKTHWFSELGSDPPTNNAI